MDITDNTHGIAVLFIVRPMRGGQPACIIPRH